MITIHYGPAGTGKTKMLVQEANRTLGKTSGAVVFIGNCKNLMLQLDRRIRLVDAKESGINNLDGLLGLMAGLYAGNRDITDIFVDDLDQFGPPPATDLLEKLCSLCSMTNVAIHATATNEEASVVEAKAPDDIFVSFQDGSFAHHCTFAHHCEQKPLRVVGDKNE